MYSSLSLKNVKRSLRDYAIYFLTLTFAVCIFYTFNSVEAQKVMMGMNSAKHEILDLITDVMGTFSVFVAIILGFLVIYANNFLIKRRKKELGIYMTLGMSKNKISQILVIETIIIGALSLVVGLLIGVFASQGLSLITVKLFKVDLSAYKFVFSSSALIKTILCFSIIFIFVILFNSYSISRYKLIDLIYGSKKNESFKIRNKNVSLVLFILSLIILATAYFIIIKNGILANENIVYTSMTLGAIGTLLFFMSLSGFLLEVIKSRDNIYLKNLNLFVIRQIGSKINTNFVSMTLISLMLFVTICVLSSGMGINMALTKDLESRFAYEGVMGGFKDEDPIKTLKDNGIDMEKYLSSYTTYKRYESDLSFKNIITEENTDGLSSDNRSFIKHSENINIIKLSDYNKLMKLQNKDEIHLEDNEYVIFAGTEDMVNAYNKFLQKSNNNIKIYSKEYKSKNNEAIYVNIDNGNFSNSGGTIILNDNEVKNLKVDSTTLIMNFNDEFKDEDEKRIQEKADEIYNKSNYETYYNLMTKEKGVASLLGTSIMISYLGTYIGIVFLITSGAVLALQQLSEAADNIERYNLLRKIGTERSMINKALFTQIGIYFLMPLGLSIVHSIVGLKVSNDVIKEFGNASMIENIIIASIFICIVYGAYFLATFMGAKNIIKNSK
jgi:putative ABC transport system permease protein